MYEHDPIRFNYLLYLWDEIANAIVDKYDSINDEQWTRQQNTINELKSKCGVN